MSPVPTSKHWRMEVEWVDSTLTHQEGWVTMAAVLSRRKRRDAVRCLSVGFVLADDDAGIVLAATVHGNEVAGITHVPAGAIVSRRRLRPDLQEPSRDADGTTWPEHVQAKDAGPVPRSPEADRTRIPQASGKRRSSGPAVSPQPIGGERDGSMS